MIGTVFVVPVMYDIVYPHPPPSAGVIPPSAVILAQIGPPHCQNLQTISPEISSPARYWGSQARTGSSGEGGRTAERVQTPPLHPAIHCKGHTRHGINLQGPWRWQWVTLDTMKLQEMWEHLQNLVNSVTCTCEENFLFIYETCRSPKSNLKLSRTRSWTFINYL